MTPNGILDIIILIYYVPALLLSLLAMYRHGASRQAGWINLTLLSIFRTVGSATGIAAEYKPSTGLIATSLVLSNMGTISLLGALLGVTSRVNLSMREHQLPPKAPRFTQLATIAASILAIVGGTKLFSSDPSEQSTGETCFKASVCLLLAIYIVAAFVTLHTLAFKRYVLDGEMRLLWVAFCSLPFVLVRLALAFCTAFRPTDPVFSMRSTSTTNTIVHAIMGVAMEFVVVAMFLWAGLTVKPVQKEQASIQQQWYTSTMNPNDNFTRGHGNVEIQQGLKIQTSYNTSV